MRPFRFFEDASFSDGSSLSEVQAFAFASAYASASLCLCMRLGGEGLAASGLGSDRTSVCFPGYGKQSSPVQ